MKPWPRDCVEHMRQLYFEGKSFRDIANLYGENRNVIAGLAFRNKFTRPDKPRQPPKPRKPREKIIRLIQKSQEAVVQIKKKPRCVKVKKGMSLHDVTEGKNESIKFCRSIIGDPKNLRICGCEAVNGTPYCAEHSRIYIVKHTYDPSKVRSFVEIRK